MRALYQKKMTFVWIFFIIITPIIIRVLIHQLVYIFKLELLLDPRFVSSKKNNFFYALDLSIRLLKDKLLFGTQKKILFYLLCEKFEFLCKNMKDLFENNDDIIEINKKYEDVKKENRDILKYVKKEDLLTKFLVSFEFCESLIFYFQNFEYIKNKEGRMLGKISINFFES
jgi:hypothetical protein